MSFKKLTVWGKSMKLVKDVYEATKIFPREEQYGLTQQIRRAAVSIPSNIAEGSQRVSDKEFSNFLLISRGSLAEVETQLLIAQDLGYISKESMDELSPAMEEISKMLHSFHSKLTA